MPLNDVVTVSHWPVFVGDKDRLAAVNWPTENSDSFKKPYTMVETNEAAERPDSRKQEPDGQLGEGVEEKPVRIRCGLVGVAI